VGLDVEKMIERVRHIRRSAELLMIEKLFLLLSFSFSMLGLVSLPFYWYNISLGWVSWGCVLLGYMNLGMSQIVKKEREDLGVMV
jgi:hypothetical protein